MTIYSFRRMSRLVNPKWGLTEYAEIKATVKLLQADRAAVKAVSACTGATMRAWLTVTRTDGRVRMIGVRAVRRLGERGFMACVHEARHELGLV